MFYVLADKQGIEIHYMRFIFVCNKKTVFLHNVGQISL